MRGFGLLEVVVGTSIVLVSFLAVMNALAAAEQLNRRNLELTRASFLLTEGVEAMKMLRAAGWQTNIVPLTPGTAYYLAWDGAGWQTTTIPNLVSDRFDRRLTLNTAYRDENDDLSPSGTADPDTRLLSITVAWLERGATTTATTTTYLTNLFGN